MTGKDSEILLCEIFFSEIFFSGFAYEVGGLSDGAYGASQNNFLETSLLAPALGMVQVLVAVFTHYTSYYNYRH